MLRVGNCSIPVSRNFLPRCNHRGNVGCSLSAVHGRWRDQNLRHHLGVTGARAEPRPVPGNATPSQPVRHEGQADDVSERRAPNRGTSAHAQPGPGAVREPRDSSGHPSDSGCRGDSGRGCPGVGGPAPPRPHLVGAELGPVLAAQTAQEGLGLPAQRLPGAHEVRAAHVQPHPLGGGGGRGNRPGGPRRRSGCTGAGRPRRPPGARAGRAAPRRPLGHGGASAPARRHRRPRRFRLAQLPGKMTSGGSAF